MYTPHTEPTSSRCSRRRRRFARRTGARSRCGRRQGPARRRPALAEIRFDGASTASRRRIPARDPLVPRRRRVPALRAAGRRRARDARRVPDVVHAVSSRGLARLPAGDLRVADLHRAADRAWTSPTRRSTTARRRWPKARSWRINATGRKAVLVSRPCIRTIARCCAPTPTGSTSTSTSCRTPPTARPISRRSSAALADQRYAAVVVQSPNFFGAIDALAPAAAAAIKATRTLLDRRGGRSALARRAGDARVVGRGHRRRRRAQSFGNAVAYGGPHVGFIATTSEHLRRIPGRLVGRPVDKRRAHRVRADAAGARAAHPPRKSDLEHLHQSSALRARSRRSISPRWGRPACATSPRTTWRARERCAPPLDSAEATRRASPRRTSTSSSLRVARPGGRRARRARASTASSAASTSAASIRNSPTAS